MSESKENRFGAFLGGAVLGGALGALLGMLLAPRSGVETRHQFTEGMQDVREKSSQLFSGVRDNAGERMSGVKDRLSRRISLISEAFDAGRRAASEVRAENHVEPGEARME